MDVVRRLSIAIVIAAFGLGAVACSAEGNVGEDGIDAQIEGEDGGGEGGD